MITTRDGNGRGRVQRRTWFSRRAMHDRSLTTSFQTPAHLRCGDRQTSLAAPRRAMGSTGRAAP